MGIDFPFIQRRASFVQHPAILYSTCKVHFRSAALRSHNGWSWARLTKPFCIWFKVREYD